MTLTKNLYTIALHARIHAKPGWRYVEFENKSLTGAIIVSIIVVMSKEAHSRSKCQCVFDRQGLYLIATITTAQTAQQSRPPSISIRPQVYEARLWHDQVPKPSGTESLLGFLTNN